MTETKRLPKKETLSTGFRFMSGRKTRQKRESITWQIKEGRVQRGHKKEVNRVSERSGASGSMGGG